MHAKALLDFTRFDPPNGETPSIVPSDHFQLPKLDSGDVAVVRQNKAAFAVDLSRTLL